MSCKGGAGAGEECVTQDARSRARALVERHGFNATSFQVLEGSFRYWFDGDNACVAYVETKGAWVAAGAPICSEERLDEVAHRFVHHARQHRRRAAFFAVERRFQERTSLRSMAIGAQPTWVPAMWQENVRASRSLREQLRRSRAKGVLVRELLEDPWSPSSSSRIARLAARFLASRVMAPMGFLVEVSLHARIPGHRYFVAECAGRLVGFLDCVPVCARRGWFFRHLLRDPLAPNGTVELLVDVGMRAFAELGSPYATLGLLPLAGAVPGPLRAARHWLRGLYDFRGLHAFKAKLRPHHWEPIYLCFSQEVSPARAAVDSLLAFAQGNFLAFGWSTLLRGPSLLLRAMALCLIPWTLLLCRIPTSMFPWPWVKWGWVAFDALVLGALYLLSLRYRRSLAVVLACAVTSDAVLSAAEALTYHAPRLHDAPQRLVLVVACIAPLWAAVVLWGTVHRNEVPATH